MAMWIGGGEGLYDDPIPRLETASEPERVGILAPKCLIEVGMYDRRGKAQGIAVSYIHQLCIPEFCDGHYARAFNLAASVKHRLFIDARDGKDVFAATSGPGTLYHFCTCKRTECRTVTHTRLNRADGHGLKWDRQRVVHVDVYRHINDISEATTESQVWLRDWHDIIHQRQKQLASRVASRSLELWPRKTLLWNPSSGPSVLNYSIFSLHPECVTKDEEYMQWMNTEIERLGFVPYYAYTDDTVRLHREQLQEASAPHRAKVAEDRRLARRRKRDERNVNVSKLCRCGRPPANAHDNLFWCLLCTKPTGDEAADQAGMVHFGSARMEEADERCGEDLVWSFESGCWQLIPESAVETEYTRAFRRKPGFSKEYVNAYLYLQRIELKSWLENFDNLEAWLDERPGDFVSLPRYPSSHAKTKYEKRLGQFVEDNNFLRLHDVEARGSPVLLAKHRLLVSLDGWSVDVTRERIGIHGRKSSTWAVMFEEVVAWRREHGLWQNPRRESADPQEKKLAAWLHEQKKLLKQGKLSEQRRSFIEGDSLQESRWEQSFFQADVWFVHHDASRQMPRRTASDEKERRVAMFLENQRKRFSNLSVMQRKKLKATSWWKHAAKGSAPSVKKRSAVSMRSCDRVLKRPARD